MRNANCATHEKSGLNSTFMEATPCHTTFMEATPCHTDSSKATSNQLRKSGTEESITWEKVEEKSKEHAAGRTGVAIKVKPEPGDGLTQQDIKGLSEELYAVLIVNTE